MDIEKERKSFEEFWAKNYDLDDLEVSEFSEILNEYESSEIWTDELNKAWLAWQAAKAQAVPEGFVLVPKEPTLEMLENAANEHVLHGASYAGIYKAMIEAAQGEEE